jgi:hypothetical protein
MTKTRLGLVMSATLVLAACGEHVQRSVGPVLHAPLASQVTGAAGTWSTCPDTTSLISQIHALFTGGNDTAAVSKLENIAALLGPTPPGPNPATAQAHTINLIGFTLTKYQSGKLNGGYSSDTQDQLVLLINGLLCFAGLPQSFFLDDLGSDGAWAILSSTSPDTTITTGTKWAGVKVDSGSVTQTSLLTITRLNDTIPWLLTQLDQYPVYYEYSITPSQPFELPVLVGECLAPGISPGPPDTSRLRLAHNVAPYTNGSIEILPYAPVGFLDCSDVGTYLGAKPSGNPFFDFAQAGWRAVRPVLSSLLLPRQLMAFAASGVGGTTRNFSPFGLVDTLLVMTPNSSADQRYPVSDTVPSAPSVAVNTPQGHPYSGLPVTFAVTAGGGTLTGASKTTDASGIATAGSWALGSSVGTNTVTATATPPYPDHATIDGNPQTFTATALPPSQVKFQSQPSSTVAGSAIMPAVTVAIEDEDGHVVTSSSASVSLSLRPTGPTLGGTTTVAAVNGVATFSDLTITKAGTGYTLIATSGSLAPDTSNAFSITAAAADSINAVAGDDQTATEGTAVAIAPAVRVSDAYGNPVSGVTVMFEAQNGGSVSGATQTTDGTGTATVGSWTVVAGTNYLLATTGLGLVGEPVRFTATGTSFTTTLVDCPPSVGARDDLTRAFYHPKYPGRSLKQVVLYLSSNASANTPAPYTIQLTARSGGFTGSLIGTSTVTVFLQGKASENLPTNFVFDNAASIQRNSTVTFQFQVLSNPTGAALTFNVGSCGVGDTHCKSKCPIVETNDASGTLSTMRREGCGVTILGGN